MQLWKPRKEPTPLSEDRGLFKSGVVDISLTLLPFTKKSSRGDLIYVGAIDGSEVEVVFAGRRVSDTEPLNQAVARQKKSSDAERNFQLNAKGVWRTKLVSQNEIEAERVYQFVVAEWSVPDENGGGTTFGEPPLTE